MPLAFVAALRSLLAFVALLVVTRLMGKKHLSQLTFFDYAVAITIGSIASTMSVELESQTVVGLTGILTWGTLTLTLSLLALRSRAFQRLVEGEPTPVIDQGRILEGNLRQEGMTLDDLRRALRAQQIFRLRDVETAILEPGGKLSVLLKGDRRPITGHDLGLSVPTESVPTVVIDDGKVLDHSLQQLGLDRPWLEKRLRQQHVGSVAEVTLAQLDSAGNLWLDLRDDDGQPDVASLQMRLLGRLMQVQGELQALARSGRSQGDTDALRGAARDARRLTEQLEAILRSPVRSDNGGSGAASRREK